jgi:excisionase family DNA binding protein
VDACKSFRGECILFCEAKMIRDDIPDARSTPHDLFDQPATIADRRTSVRRAPSPPNEIPFMQRPTCTIKEACKAAGMGRTKFYELINGGELKITPVGRRRLVQVPSLLRFLKVEDNEQRNNPR